MQRLRSFEHDGNPILIATLIYHKSLQVEHAYNAPAFYNNKMCIILVGLFRYQPYNYGEKYKVTRFNGQAIHS